MAPAGMVVAPAGIGARGGGDGTRGGSAGASNAGRCAWFESDKVYKLANVPL